MAEEQLVLFRLGNEEYAISITQVKEIIHYRDVTKLPDIPEYIEGIISLRGKIIPVVDLAMRLALTKSKADDKRALIVETTGLEIGIVVDEVTEVIRLQDSAIEAPPVAAANVYIRGIGKEGDRLLIILDVDRLFGDEELKELKKAG
ncbi:MAG TPA: chemotaxis protein CheW [Selenomonadales bacterium]|nr:chemotaxis protein CheW [Selenomonadales bacterium]